MRDKQEMINMIKSTKEISPEKISFSEANLHRANFKEGLFMPNDLIRLTRYHHDLCRENIIHTLETGERIPAIVNVQRIMNEIQVDAERLEMFLFAGEMLIYQLELMSMPSEQYEEEANMVYNPEECELEDEDMQDLMEHLSDMSEAYQKQKEEIDMLTKLFAQDNEEENQ